MDSKMNDIRIALEGGKPVRKSPLPYQTVGAGLIGQEEIKLVTEVLKTKTLFRHYGPTTPHMVDDFEKEARKNIGAQYALAMATGSGAYFCAINALGIGCGDEVIIPAYGWITDYACVALSGAVPVFADIDDSLNLNPEAFKKKITRKTKAVIVIAYQGAASRLDEIVSIAKKHNIKVIEDVAQAFGCEFNGKKLGTWGDVGCFSLQANKVIAAGDGGLITTNDQEIYERAVRFHDLGMLRDSFQKLLKNKVKTKPSCGMQWRMNELTGAVGLAQLRKLPKLIQKTKRYSLELRAALEKEINDIKFRDVKPENDIGIGVFFNLASRENVDFFNKAYLAEGLIPGPTSYCKTMSKIDVVKECLIDAGRFNPDDFEKTKLIEEKVAAIAVLPVYTKNDIKSIIKGAVKVLKVMKSRGMF